jgi:hypothetical protein
MDYATRERRIHAAGAKAMLVEAARIRAELCASRNLLPSSGCRACGAVEAPRCEHCTGVSECDSEGGEL